MSSATVAVGCRAHDATRIVSMTRNGAFIFATTAINSVVGYSFWILVARRLSRAELGYATASVALFSLAAQFADRGLSTTIMQRSRASSGEADRNRLFTVSIGLVLRGAAAAMALAIVVALVLLPGLISRLGVLGVVACVVCAAATATGRIFDTSVVSRLTARLMTLRNALAALGKVALFAALSTFSASVSSVLIAWGTSSLVATVVLTTRHGFARSDAARTDDTRTRDDLSASLTRSSRTHLMGNLGGELPQFLMPLLVLSIAGPSISGSYGITAMVAGGFFVVSSAMSSSMLAHGTGDLATIKRLTRHVGSIVLPICITAVCLAALVGDRALGFFTASVARSGHGLLIILAVSTVPDAVTNVWIARWLLQHRQARAASMNVLIGVTAVVLTGALLGRLGVNAVGWAWLIAQTIGCLVVVAWEIVDKNERRHRADPAGV